LANPRQKIRDELDRLIAAGDNLKLGAEIAHRSVEDQEEIKSKLEAVWKKSAKGKAAAKAADHQTKHPVVVAAEARFGPEYQSWYSQALRVVEQLLPDRLQEFRDLYRPDKQPKALHILTYAITDYIHGTTIRDGFGNEEFSSHGIAMTRFGDQISILASAQARLDSLLTDIEGTLEATLLDDELKAAEGLLKAKYLRSAGIVAGVVLERHLKTLLTSHGLSLGRKKSQIGNLNDALKDGGVIDVPRWREIQHLADIRNLCGHDAEREPTSDEVSELIRSTEKIVATVF
jgi:hypothetical protein